MKVIIGEAAFRDLNDIHDYIATDAPHAAQHQVLSLLAALDSLQYFPSMGRAGVIDGTRELIIQRHYIAVYRVRAKLDIIEIIAIVHTSRER